MAPKKASTHDENAPTSSETTLGQSSPQRHSQKSNENKGNSSISGRVGGDGPRAKPTHRSKRAGVVFPVLRLHKILKKNNTSYQIRSDASVYMAGVLEYLIAEVTELAGNVAREHKRHRIIPRHIFLAIHNDEELSKLCENVMIAAGGVLPQIHQVLLPSNVNSQSMKGDVPIEKKKQSKSKKSSQTDKTNLAI